VDVAEAARGGSRVAFVAQSSAGGSSTRSGSMPSSRARLVMSTQQDLAQLKAILEGAS